MASKQTKTIVLILCGLGLLALIFFFFNPSEHSFFLPCPFRYVTGYECPGCGSQRAIHQLLHGNLSAAFHLNPLMVISLPLVVYAFTQKAHNFIFDTRYRVGLFYRKWFIYGYFTIVILFWILRNVL